MFSGYKTKLRFVLNDPLKKIDLAEKVKYRPGATFAPERRPSSAGFGTAGVTRDIEPENKLRAYITDKANARGYTLVDLAERQCITETTLKNRLIGRIRFREDEQGNCASILKVNAAEIAALVAPTAPKKSPTGRRPGTKKPSR